jgi:hypothetical protein
MQGEQESKSPQRQKLIIGQTKLGASVLSRKKSGIPLDTQSPAARVLLPVEIDLGQKTERHSGPNEIVCSNKGPVLLMFLV